jgi:short-subunit dehydrogenase
MLSECLRAELASSRIGVTAVCPGFASTNIVKTGVFVGGDAEHRGRVRSRGEKAIKLRNYPPEKVAERVVDAIVKNRAVVPINFEGHLLRALSRISPASTRLLARIPVQ